MPPAKPAAAKGFRRCATVIRRPLLSALLLLGAQGMLSASPVMAQSEPVAVTEDAMATPVNINTASAAELADGLSGIGVSKAEAIVRYREQFGPFESVEELSEVTGIGDSTVERNRGVISIH
jgi:competence protein ComEA